MGLGIAGPGTATFLGGWCFTFCATLFLGYRQPAVVDHLAAGFATEPPNAETQSSPPSSAPANAAVTPVEQVTGSEIGTIADVFSTAFPFLVFDATCALAALFFGLRRRRRAWAAALAGFVAASPGLAEEAETNTAARCSGSEHTAMPELRLFAAKKLWQERVNALKRRPTFWVSCRASAPRPGGAEGWLWPLASGRRWRQRGTPAPRRGPTGMVARLLSTARPEVDEMSYGGKEFVEPKPAETLKEACGNNSLQAESTKTLVCKTLDEIEACQPSAIPLARILVVGLPGHGKSTLLNELAGQDIFETAAGSEPGTKPGGENTRFVEVADGGRKQRLELIDTPGFPQLDAKQSADAYKEVMTRCGEFLSVVVFVLNPDRKSADSCREHLKLWGDFAEIDTQLVVVANGFEPAKRERESEEQFAKRREGKVEALKRTARELADEARFSVQEILVSFCIDDLEGVGKALVRFFASSPSRRACSIGRTDVTLQTQVASAPVAGAPSMLASWRPLMASAADDGEP